MATAGRWLKLSAFVGLVALLAILARIGDREHETTGGAESTTSGSGDADEELSPLQKLLRTTEIPPLAHLAWHTDLAEAMRSAREKGRPVLHFMVRSREDPDWKRFLAALEEDVALRAIYSSCVRVVQEIPDLPVSPSAALFAFESVPSEQARLQPGSDASTVVSELTGEPLDLAAGDTQGEPHGSHDPAAASMRVERHRLVEFFVGLRDFHDWAARTWSVVLGEPFLDKMIGKLREGRLGEQGLRLLLGDEYYGLITPDERIRAVTQLLRHRPGDLWAVHRVCTVAFSDLRHPLDFLPVLRQLYTDPESPQRRLVESQVALFVYSNPQDACEHLEVALKGAPDSPQLLERMVVARVRHAETLSDAAARRAEIDQAGSALRRLWQIAPGFPNLLNMRHSLSRLGLEIEPPVGAPARSPSGRAPDQATEAPDR